MGYSWFDDYLLGYSTEAYKHFGAHFTEKDGKQGILFRVYAPLAKEINLIGEFNNWNIYANQMEKVDDRGIYECFIENAKEYQSYKYHILGADNVWHDKADPFGFFAELRPGSCSRTFDIRNFIFHDEEFLKNRDRNFDKPVSIYEVHLASWLGKVDGRFLSYEEIAPRLIQYVKEHGFTHVEIMPITQYPFDGSWGYQAVGYYAVDSRYGNPKQLMSLVDQLHQAGIGIILDFVPVHFAVDGYGLNRFDGSTMYEYSNEHEYSQWGSKNFDLGKDPVRSFLMSSVNYFVDMFHFDGVRFDAVSNIIYWDGNGSNPVNEGAVEFIKRVNGLMHQKHPDIMMIAEDSSAYGQVTKGYGGLGFDYKWDLGWMNDTLKYYGKDPIYRKYHHNQLTFSMAYFYSENFMLPLSHDEVVHGKGTILNKMWGSYEDKFAQVRNLYAYQFAHPGKKLNFMGNELGSFDEWNENKSIPWELKKFPKHDSVSRLFRDLNLIYQNHKAMYFEEYNQAHFQWIMADNAEQSVLVFKREVPGETMIFVFNMTPRFYSEYDIGVPYEGEYEEILNTDKDVYGGWNQYNGANLFTHGSGLQNQPYRITIKLASFAGIFLRYIPKIKEEEKPVIEQKAEPIKQASAKKTTTRKRASKK